MPLDIGNRNPDAGFEIVLSNFEAFDNEFKEPKYDKIHWNKVIPGASVETSIPEGANQASYGVKDWSGRGEFRQDMDGGVSTVGMNVSKPAVIPILDAGVGGIIDRTDIRSYSFAHGGRLDVELPQIMRKACQRHVETVFFYGYAPGDFEPWMDYSLVTTTQAALNGAATSRAWADKTGDEIAADINTAISTIWTTTKEHHIAGNIAIPSTQYADLATRRLVDLNMTVLEWIKKNNLYTAQTGQELDIMSLPHLEGAGAGATQRMVVWEHDKQNFKMPFPIPFRLLAPQIVGYQMHLLAEYKFGSFHVAFPKAMLYVDEI